VIRDIRSVALADDVNPVTDVVLVHIHAGIEHVFDNLDSCVNTEGVSEKIVDNILAVEPALHNIDLLLGRGDQIHNLFLGLVLSVVGTSGVRNIIQPLDKSVSISLTRSVFEPNLIEGDIKGDLLVGEGFSDLCPVLEGTAEGDGQ
jgi:hypothetical protein